MIQTRWNTDYYTPQPVWERQSRLSKAGEPHYQAGELHAHVLVALLAGARTLREICPIVKRIDKRVRPVLEELTAHGYVQKVKINNYTVHWRPTNA